MNNCVLITGCSSGIGRATAFYFQSQGWRVVATMRSPEKETELLKLKDTIVEQLDVTSTVSIENAVAKALSIFDRIDVLVNNAGVGAYSVFEEVEEVDEAVIRETFETNVFGTMWVTRALLPHFRKNKRGTIINVISTIPQIGAPLTTLYCATKKAIEGFSSALYYELLPLGIRVKLVQPGTTSTSISMQKDFPCQARIEEYSAISKAAVDNFRHRFETEHMAPPTGPAKVIFEAAISDSGRFRYVSGRDANMVNVMTRLLPEHVLKNMAGRMFGMKQQDA